MHRKREAHSPRLLENIKRILKQNMRVFRTSPDGNFEPPQKGQLSVSVCLDSLLLLRLGALFGKFLLCILAHARDGVRGWTFLNELKTTLVKNKSPSDRWFWTVHGYDF